MLLGFPRWPVGVMPNGLLPPLRAGGRPPPGRGGVAPGVAGRAGPGVPGRPAGVAGRAGDGGVGRATGAPGPGLGAVISPPSAGG
jgi:hypothetical protein